MKMAKHIMVRSYTGVLNNFKDNMRNKRLELKMTQGELAKIVGVSTKTIQNYENLKTVPSPTIMEAIATALGISFNEIVSEDEETSRKIEIAKYLTKAEENAGFDKLLEEVSILSYIYDKIDFEKQVSEKIISEERLDEILRGKLDISKDEKVKLIKTMFDTKIKNELDKAEEKMRDNFNEYATAFRAFSLKDWSIIPKKDFFGSDK
jgi:transcriptional regulator with XRE-family HTH domain